MARGKLRGVTVKMRLMAAGAALCLVGLGLTACGGGDDTATDTTEGSSAESIDVKAASAWLDEADAVTYTITVALDQAAVDALNAQEKKKSDRLSAEAVDMINDATVVVTASTKDEAAASAISVQFGGASVIDVVADQKTLYLKVDGSSLPQMLDDELQKSGADLTQAAAMLDMFAPGAGDVLRNKWVSIDLEQIQELSGATPTVTPDAGTAQEAQKIVKGLLDKVTVAEDSSDPTHRTATIKGADLKEVIGELSALGAQAGADSIPQTKELENAELPDEITVDLYFDGDQVNKVGIDLMQFADDPSVTEGAELLIAFAEGTPVAAPSDAKKIDLSKIADSMKGMMGGGLVTG